MKPSKIFKLAFNMVRGSKLRSWITIIGVVVAVASVITIISAGELMEKQVTHELEKLGGDVISVYAITTETSSKTPELTKTDVLVIKGIPSVKYVDKRVNSYSKISYGDKELYSQITGVDPAVWPKITQEKVETGRMLQPGDKNVVVISNYLANEEFNRKININQIIKIGNKSFRVIGILDNDSSGLASLFSGGIYAPLDSVYDIEQDSDYSVPKERGTYDSLEIKLKENVDTDAAVQDIEQKLRTSRHVTEKNQDFYISSAKSFIESSQSIIGGITLFLSFIAGISLIVGAFGISNTMFTAVLEKTKEIGIMKAIGAKNEDILLLFLFNSGLIGLAGGFLGLLIGVLITQVITYVIALKFGTPFELYVSIKAVVVALVVSIGAGILAGAVPAYNASKLKPVDALRSE
ncbi:putative ABC transport system permease protein [Methanococcus maripaludis]|uniref:Putative ABC transport system permease protein n=1 Tax=Methanococcus maripaludis TaxID=39152 RepID=A0A7J9NNG9_METMI|nr:ABC transporter permease [Methanococcus maripaludis]MBA2846589.1 putative ABC transport system permease protein [Methanococcus maripaludis]